MVLCHISKQHLLARPSDGGSPDRTPIPMEHSGPDIPTIAKASASCPKRAGLVRKPARRIPAPHAFRTASTKAPSAAGVEERLTGSHYAWVGPFAFNSIWGASNAHCFTRGFHPVSGLRGGRVEQEAVRARGPHPSLMLQIIKTGKMSGNIKLRRIAGTS